MERAVKAVKPATPRGQMLASVPPAAITSASPYWMLRMASPMELVPVAQAVTTLMLFPFKPNIMETLPAAMFEIIRGTIRGLTLDGPFVRIFSCSFSVTWRLPIPEPMDTPTL